jgi:hypothetical protein
LSFLRAAAHYGPFRKEILPNGPWITYHAWWLFRLTAGGVWWPPPGSRLGGSPGTAVSKLTRSPGGQSEFGFGWAELVAAQDGHASAARRRGEPAVMVISLNRYPGSGSAGAAGEIPVGVVPAGGGLGLPVRW